MKKHVFFLLFIMIFAVFGIQVSYLKDKQNNKNSENVINVGVLLPLSSSIANDAEKDTLFSGSANASKSAPLNLLIVGFHTWSLPVTK